ncbi:MAG: VCBS repeat-containing protein [Deltaproteobacteria bacterium]|nr:VCBS repeat-containing protein [Deltaproteobacteria bacterium]
MKLPLGPVRAHVPPEIPSIPAAASAQSASEPPLPGPPTPLRPVAEAVALATGRHPAALGALVGRLPQAVLAAAMGATLALSGCTTGPTMTPPGVPAFSGIVLSSARELPGGVPVTLAPRNATDAQKMAHYKAIIDAVGGRWRQGQPYVLALRGLDLETGRISETRAQSWMHDTIVVLKFDSAGQPAVTELVGSTYPGQRTVEGKGRDVNGDGQRDVGMVAEGNFRAAPNGPFAGGPSYHLTTPSGGGGLAGVRDVDHDGLHSPEEWAGSKRRGDALHEILFHPGFGENVNSVGCFNVREYDQFVQALGGPGASFGVSVVNAYGDEPR